MMFSSDRTDAEERGEFGCSVCGLRYETEEEAEECADADQLYWAGALGFMTGEV